MSIVTKFVKFHNVTEKESAKKGHVAIVGDSTGDFL